MIFLKTVARSVRYSFWNVWDHLFPYLGVNLLWFLFHTGLVSVYIYFVLPEMGRSVSSFDVLRLNLLEAFWNKKVGLMQTWHVLLALSVLLQFSPFTTAIYAVADKLTHKERFAVQHYVRALRRHFFPSLQITATASLAILVSYTSIHFYQSILRDLRFLSNLACSLAFLFLLFFLMVCVYFQPLLIREEKGFTEILRRGCVLVLENFLSSFFLFLLFIGIASIGVLGAPFVLIFFFLYPAFFVQLNYEHYITLTERYGSKRSYEEKRGLIDLVTVRKSR